MSELSENTGLKTNGAASSPAYNFYLRNFIDMQVYTSERNLISEPGTSRMGVTNVNRAAFTEGGNQGFGEKSLSIPIREVDTPDSYIIEPRSADYYYETINESKLHHLVDSGNIWDKFDIIKSPGDGHCLLYSIIESMRCQLNCTKINLSKLIQCITTELVLNKHFYIDFTDYMSGRNMEDAMNMYIHSRLYDTSYGDLVPIIIANVLCINIAIATQNTAHCLLITYRDCVMAKCNNTVFISKNQKHYDGMSVNANVSSNNLQCECNICCHDAVMPTSVCCETQRPDVGTTHTEMNATERDQLDRAGPAGENDCHFPDSTEITTSMVKCMLKIPGVGNGVDNADWVDEISAPMSMQNLSLSNKYRDVLTRAERNSVTCCSWNINGLTESKLHDDILVGFLKTHDIILLTETWTSETDSFFLDGYIFHNYPRNFKHHNALRNSGGIGIFVRKSDGIVIGKCSEDMIAWIMLKKQYFGLERDIYIANVYIVPETSAYLCHDAFGILQWDITSRPLESDVILCGDYNAHTNVAVDFVIDELEGSNGDLDSLIPNDSKESLEIIFDMYSKKQLGRYSADKKPLTVTG